MTITSGISDEDTTKNAKRIYIGGLDPMKLTVQDLLMRLQDHLPKPFHINDIHYSSQASSASYVHFTATLNSSSTMKTDDDGMDNKNEDIINPYNIIHKIFHNVTWKGCKLKVEHARPHFLERLQREICERQQFQKEEQKASECSLNPFLEENSTKSVASRRFLKIKRAYGQECWKVDTKPFLVSDWDEFRKMQQRLKRKKEMSIDRIKKENNFVSKTQSNDLETGETMSISDNRKPRYNRSIHLRFVDSMEDGNRDSTTIHDNTKIEKFHGKENAYDENCSTPSRTNRDEESSDTNTDFDSDKEDNYTDVRMEENNGRKVGEYIWSDDESCTQSSQDKVGKIIPSVRSQNDFETSDRLLSTGCNQDEFDTTFPDITWNTTEVQDDDDNQDEYFHQDQTNNIQSTNTQPTADIDLELDVHKNLSILYQIFPDAKKNLSVASSGMEDLKRIASRSKNAGWDVNGQMLRYDPKRHESKPVYHEMDLVAKVAQPENEDTTILCAQQADKGKMEIVDFVKNAAVSEDDSKKQSSNELLNVLGTVERDTFGKIYQQDQLEKVFRQARESSAGHVFAFPELKEVENEPSSFSFSFPLMTDADGDLKGKELLVPVEACDVEQPKVSEENLPNSECLENNFEENDRIDFSTQNQTKTKLRLKYDFLLDDTNANHVSVLDGLVHFSYHHALSNGESKRIMDDLSSYRTDSSIKEMWNEDRKRLTADWKKKRKFALSRKKK